MMSSILDVKYFFSPFKLVMIPCVMPVKAKIYRRSIVMSSVAILRFGLENMEKNFFLQMLYIVVVVSLNNV